METPLLTTLPAECSTSDVARALGLAVRSVQLMVDRGELEAWKTSGGHRRIARASVERWLARHQGALASDSEGIAHTQASGAHGGFVLERRARGQRRGATVRRRRWRVLLMEDSVQFRDQVKLLVVRYFPEVDLHVADDVIVGLVMVGELRPDVLIVDFSLPDIDGALLVTRLRSHPQFERSRLIVVTAREPESRASDALALSGLPVIHKQRLVQDLPELLARCLTAPD